MCRYMLDVERRENRADECMRYFSSVCTTLFNQLKLVKTMAREEEITYLILDETPVTHEPMNP